jgi:hypothetical protein
LSFMLKNRTLALSAGLILLLLSILQPVSGRAAEMDAHDGKIAYLGSISLSPDSIAFNRWA